MHTKVKVWLRHIRAEEFYFVLEGTGRMRGDETFPVPNLRRRVGRPEVPGAKTKPDMSLISLSDPTQLPKELAGADRPPKS